MNYETPQKSPEPAANTQLPVSTGQPVTHESPGRDAGGGASATARPAAATNEAPDRETVVVVKGQTVGAQDAKASPKESSPKPKDAPKAVSDAKVKQQGQLPALADDADVGVQKEYVVTRDGKADIAFPGTLLASAAPPSAPKGKWQEYRVYETGGGKYVFSKVNRSVFAEDQDEHEAEVFDPSPSSMPSQLLRSVRDAARSQPLTWKDAAVDFFGFDPLAKTLYRKLGDQFEEHIS